MKKILLFALFMLVLGWFMGRAFISDVDQEIVASPLDSVIISAQLRDPLKGIGTITPVVAVTWNAPISGQLVYTQELESAFEEGLTGIEMKLGGGFAILNCTVIIKATDNVGVVSVSEEVWLKELMSPAVPSREVDLAGDIQFASTWRSLSLNTIEADGLNGRDQGKSCVKQFELAWRSSNKQ